MRSLTYYVATSIDGYIAGPNGEFDFYPLSDDLARLHKRGAPRTVPTHIRKQIGFDAPNKRFDTVLMGRAPTSRASTSA